MEMATLSLVGSAARGLFGFMGAQQTASATAGASNYQATVARNNQLIAQQNATQAAKAGAVQAQNRDFINKQRMGAIEAAQSASGIDLGVGSPTEVRRSAEMLGRLDTATVMSNALERARSEEVSAMNFSAQADLDKMQAQQARTAGMISGFSSLIGGASSFADKWARYRSV